MRFNEHKFILNGKRPEACSDLIRWGTFFHGADRHVGSEQVGPMWISTVFLGMNHRFMGEGAPILFETMVFSDSDEDSYQERYCTWEEAEAGHAKAVAMCKKMLADADVTAADVMAKLKGTVK